MTHDKPTRRRVLYLSGSLAVAGLAGCSGSDTDSADGGSAAETATTTPSDHAEEDHHDESEGDSDGDHHDEEGAGDHDDEHDEESEDDHGHNHDEGTPQEPSPSAEVTMRTEGGQQHYDPHVVWIEPGGSVTWRLESGQHDAVAYHPDNDDKPRRIPEEAESWRIDLLTEEGTTASQTFETEGVYDYYCTPHESLGMVATVIVGEPDPHEQPALEEPQSSLPEGARAELADLGEQVNEALGHTH